ncbi:STAS domain-containing protein [Bacillus testis]|uniref:STAS domain-containing protein n=1 Tax=Bacillus testis TaxID=1622072 RepID=UPI00067EB091|nr:STAS domain-containing protein [Bacillus testis]
MNSAISIKGEMMALRNFEEAADSIIKMMSLFIDINSLFIAKNDNVTNHIVKALNQEEILISAGEELPFKETFCKLSVDFGRDILIIPDINQSELACHLDVTRRLGGGCFIGIPIYYKNGENYGTICGLDSRPFEFTDKHVELFKSMAKVLSYVLELDKANREIQHLSAPFVPITKGVAVLPIIGEMDDKRVESIIALALSKSQELELDYLIIDLSGISQIHTQTSDSLLKMVSLLQLIGVEPLLTGIHPSMALDAVKEDIHLGDILIEANLEQALIRLGFSLVKR